MIADTISGILNTPTFILLMVIYMAGKIIKDQIRK